ncbi:MAG: helix-turn-helix domain-containing protein [Anaerolineae bacterium]|nr:helix-turn-helix domain-containing protein [Anaerolineae bacterium]
MRTTNLEERAQIYALADAGHSDREIAPRLGWKMSVIRKWRPGGKRTCPT